MHLSFLSSPWLLILTRVSKFQLELPSFLSLLGEDRVKVFLMKEWFLDHWVFLFFDSIQNSPAPTKFQVFCLV